MARQTVLYVLEQGGNLKREAKATARELDDLGDEAARAKAKIEQMSRAQEGAGRIGKAFGGQIGAATTVIEDFGRGIGELSALLGPMGAAAAGAGLAMAGTLWIYQSVTTAIIGVANASIEAGQRLKEMGALSDEEAVAITNLDRAMVGLEFATDRAMVEIASGTTALTDFTNALSGAVTLAGDLVDTLTTLGSSAILSSLEGLAGRLAPLASATATIAGVAFNALAAVGADTASTAAGSWTYDGPIYGPPAPGTTPPTTSGSRGPTAQQQAEAAAMREAERLWGQIQGDFERINGEMDDLADYLHEQALASEYAAYQWQQAAKKQTEIREQMEAQAANAASMAQPATAAGKVNAIADVAGAALVPLEQLASIPDQMMSLMDRVDSLMTNIVDAPQKVVEVVERLPDVAANVATVAPELIASLVEALPDLLIAMVSMVPKFIGAVIDNLIDAFKDLFTLDFWLQAGRSIGQAFVDMVIAPLKDAVSFLTGKEGNFLGTDFTGNDKKIFGLKIPSEASYDTGGMVGRDGLAFLHAGERVLTRDEVRQGNSSSGMSIGALNINSPNPRAFLDELRALQGSYGLGLSLTPWVT